MLQYNSVSGVKFAKAETPSQLHEPMDQSGLYAQPPIRFLALKYLEDIFTALIQHNEAYVIMFEHPAHGPPRPCIHEQQQDPITGVVREGERLAYIGLLLRTAERICELRYSSGSSFASKIEELKVNRPDMAHGVAMLQFLTAGVCRNLGKTLSNLLQLVRELASLRCGPMVNHECNPINLLYIYNATPSNRILTMINRLLAQCIECGKTDRVQELVAELGPDLDPSKWQGCGDCELLLLDVLLYTRIFQIPNVNDRMLSSMRLSFNYNIDMMSRDEMKKSLEETHSCLSKLGFIKISQWSARADPPNGGRSKESMEYEVMFMSGWQEGEKKVTMFRKVFEEYDRKQLFCIQRKYQQQCPKVKCQEDDQKHRGRCCESQMKWCFDEIAKKLDSAHKALAELVPVHMIKMRVDILLEMDPCAKCKSVLGKMAVDMEQLKHITSEGIHVLSILPYEHPRNKYPSLIRPILERLMSGVNAAIQVRNDLEPFWQRHTCMVHGHCRSVRCDRHCQYSTPYYALLVKRLRRHHLEVDKIKDSIIFLYLFDYTVLYI